MSSQKVTTLILLFYTFVAVIVVFYVCYFVSPDEEFIYRKKNSVKSGHYLLKMNELKEYDEIDIEMNAYWQYGKLENARDLSVSHIPKKFCDKPTMLMVMVHSHPGNQKARWAIRDTWAKNNISTATNGSVFFFLGKSTNASIQKNVKQEREFCNDIIEGTFIDSPHSATIKSLTMLKLFTSCPKCNYLMKTSDRIYANLAQITEMLNSLSSKNNILMGHLKTRLKRNFNLSSKWIFEENYVGKSFLKFLSGSAYVISKDVAGKLYEAAASVPVFYEEDLFITGICPYLAGIRLQNHFSFTEFGLPKTICFLEKLFTVYSFDAAGIRGVESVLKDLKRQCY